MSNVENIRSQGPSAVSSLEQAKQSTVDIQDKVSSTTCTPTRDVEKEIKAAHTQRENETNQLSPQSRATSKSLPNAPGTNYKPLSPVLERAPKPLPNVPGAASKQSSAALLETTSNQPTAALKSASKPLPAPSTAAASNPLPSLPKAALNLEKSIEKIGKYGLNNEKPELSKASENKLYAGCPKKSSTEKREVFLTKLNDHVKNIKPGTNRETITLKELFGNNKELLKAYKEAVKEEATSKEFRDAVFQDSSKKLDASPCPGQKMVMYVGGPSAAGKSHAQEKFVDEVMSLRNPDKINTDGGEHYTVSVDGGVERELCQMRQMTLQAATKNGYGSITDLHKHTKTHVKSKVMAAAMNEKENVHVVIPATFISGLQKFSILMGKLANDSKAFQVFAEVRADQTSSLTPEEAAQSFEKTIVYNGESRANIPEGQEEKDTKIVMNNTKIGCESKVYENFISLGVRCSKMGKEVFKVWTNGSNSMILSYECDNMHVKKEDGKWVQTTENPTVKHVSMREVNLWNEISHGDEQDIKDAFTALNPKLSKEEVNEKYQDFMGKVTEKRKDPNFDFPDFIALLKENGCRSTMKITRAER